MNPNQIPVKVGVRDSGDEDTDPDFCYDLECRFPDGQKFATVQVSVGYQELAFLIATFLSTPELVQAAINIMEKPNG